MILSTLQVAGRGLGNGDATVLSACAADSNGKLRLALCDITRHDRIEQLSPGLPELLGLGWSKTKSETFLSRPVMVRISGS